MSKMIDDIKKYGRQKNNYKPTKFSVCYPLHSMDFIRTGFLDICPTLAARDYKDAKCVLVPTEIDEWKRE